MTGVVVASTGEAPGLNQLDIVGDRGSLAYDGTTLIHRSTDGSVAEHCETTRDMFGVPVFNTQEIVLSAAINQHATVLQNVVDSILDGTALATPLTAGLGSIELANAMLLSSWENERVVLPLNAQNYQACLDDRIQNSQPREPLELEVSIDMDASYR